MKKLGWPRGSIEHGTYEKKETRHSAEGNVRLINGKDEEFSMHKTHEKPAGGKKEG